MVFYTPQKCRSVRTKSGPGSTPWKNPTLSPFPPMSMARVRVGSKVLLRKQSGSCFTPLAVTLNISPNKWSYIDKEDNEIVFWKRVWNGEKEYQDHIINDHYLEEADEESYPDHDEPVLDKNVVCNLVDYNGWIEATGDTIYSQAKYRQYEQHTLTGKPQELYRIRLGGLVLIEKKTNLPVLATYIKQHFLKASDSWENNPLYVRMLYYGCDLKNDENGQQEIPFWNQDSNELHNSNYYWHPADPDSVDDFEDTKMIHGPPDTTTPNLSKNVCKNLDEEFFSKDNIDKSPQTPREYYKIEEDNLFISTDEEIRRDFDGYLYTKDEFEEYYGGLKEWKQCSHKKWRMRSLILYAMEYNISDDVKKILAEVLLEI
jgi:hypothetical protein